MTTKEKRKKPFYNSYLISVSLFLCQFPAFSIRCLVFSVVWFDNTVLLGSLSAWSFKDEETFFDMDLTAVRSSLALSALLLFFWFWFVADTTPRHSSFSLCRQLGP